MKPAKKKKKMYQQLAGILVMLPRVVLAQIHHVQTIRMIDLYQKWQVASEAQ